MVDFHKKVNILFLAKKPTTHFFLFFTIEFNNILSYVINEYTTKTSKSRKHCKTHAKNTENHKKCSW